MTRPTTDKVRGAIFNMLGGFFDGGRVLDLYAGSGALGIEAVSRGADFAVLVDKDRGAQGVIQENLTMTREMEKFQLMKLPADKALNQLTEPFALVFLDPPYAKEQIVAVILQLTEKKMLSAGGKIICETAKEVDLPEKIGHLALQKEKIYGITKVTIYG